MKTLNLKYQPFNTIHFFFWLFSVVIWNFILNPFVQPILYQIKSYDFDLLLSIILTGFVIPCLIVILWALKLVEKKVLYFGLILLLITFLISIYIAISIVKLDSSEGDFWCNNFKWDEFFKSFKEFIETLLQYFIHNILYVIIFHVTIIGSVYLNLKYLITNYLNYRKYGLYALLISTLSVATAISNYFLFNFILDPVFPTLFYISYFKIWELIIVAFGYLFFTTFIYLVWQYNNNLIASQQKIQNELSVLKAQINPHFLFNNMNTIFSMAERNDKRTSQVVLQLSDFLRYVLYDTESESIPLDKEIEIIRTYIELQRERIDQTHTPIELTIEGKMQNATIAPLLLLPLAENCFKHGIGQKPARIFLSISFDGKKLFFKTENTVAKHEKYKAEENRGIGVENVQKRLTLLYPERHTLNFSEADRIFRLELSIEIST